MDKVYALETHYNLNLLRCTTFQTS